VARVYAGDAVLMCSRCRTPIPGGSTFCPMCGQKAPGLDSFDTLRQELPSSLSEAAARAAAQARFAVPRPAGDDPILLTPTPEVEAGGEPSVVVGDLEPVPPRRTLVLAPGGAPLDPGVMMSGPPMAPMASSPLAPTMAIGTYPSPPAGYVPPPHPHSQHQHQQHHQQHPHHQHHPPPHGHMPPHVNPYGPPPGHYARPPISGSYRAAGPVRIPITPSPARIVIGVVVASVALWLALWFLPEYRGRLSEEVRTAIGIAAGGLGLAAFALILTGALYRAQAEVRCRICARPVIAWKGAFGLHCPLGPHHARIAWVMVILTAAFWTSLIVSGIGLLVWLS